MSCEQFLISFTVLFYKGGAKLEKSRIVSPNLKVNFSGTMFFKYAIQFSYNGNEILSLLLAQLTCTYSP